MKKFYFYLLTLVLMPCTLMQAQQTLTISDVEFDAPNGIITKYLSDYTDIIIPPSIEIAGTQYEVKSIGYNAFNSKQIQKISFPSTLVEIGSFAFSGNQLNNIELPAHITKIGNGAFNNNNITTINNTASNGIIFKRNANGTDDKSTIISYGGAVKAIEKTHIPASVTIIDRSAFFNCNLTSVELPNTVEHIGSGAFQNNKITNLILPNDPNTKLVIDNHAFFRNSISSLIIPSNIVSIDYAAFYYNSMTSLTFQGPLHYSATIGNFAFYLNSLSTLNLPEGITHIGHQAFRANNLTQVTLPNTLTIIEAYAFYENTSLSSIELPVAPIKDGYTFVEWQNKNSEKVTSINNFNSSYSAIFQKNGAHILTLNDIDFDTETGTITGYHGTATNIQIPNSFIVNNETVNIASIGPEAFSGKSLTNVVLPNSINFYSIEYKAFENNNLTEIEIPTNVSNIGGCAFNNNQITTVNGEVTNGIIYDIDNFGINKSTIISYGGAADVINFIPAHVKHLDYFAFAGNGITSVTIPDGIESIKGSFNDNAITEVNGQPSNGIIFGRNNDGTVNKTVIASYGGVADVIGEGMIPTTVKTIGYAAFAENGLTSVHIPANVRTIEIESFFNNALSGTLTIPQGVEKISWGAFYKNDISQVVLPNTMEVVGAMAFNSNNAALTSIELKDVVKDGYTFIEWQKGNDEKVNIITDFTLTHKAILQEGAHVISINDIDFDEPTGTITRYYAYNTNIEIPATINGVDVLHIGEGAFQNKNITNITLPQTLKTIGINAFFNNEIFGSLTIPQGVEKIMDEAFYQNNISQVVLPNTIQEIGAKAFDSNNAALTSIELKDAIKTGYTFVEWQNENKEKVTAIADFTLGYKAIFKEPLHVITIDDIDFDEATGTITLYKASYTNIEIPATINSIDVLCIGSEAFNNKAITNVTFPSTVKEIHDFAFANNQLRELTIPSGVNLIKHAAFNNNNVTTLNGSPSDGLIFARNTDATINTAKIISYAGASKVVDFIPQNVTTICAGAFMQSTITSVSIPSGVKFVDRMAFYLNNLNSVTFTEGIEIIAYGAFATNTIGELILPNSLKEIGELAFYDNQISNIQFGNGIHHIDKNAFTTNYISNIELPTVADISIEEKFIGWLNSNTEVVTHITDNSLAYDAQFSTPTDIEEAQNEGCIIYPNPATDVINIEYAEPISTIEVFDMAGNKILTKNNTNTITISHLQPDVYIIKINGEQLQVVKQIIKK